MISLIAGVTALPAVAVPRPWQEVCDEWLEDHPHDPAWMQSCMESIMFWEAHNPTTKVPKDPYRPRVFPYDRTWIPPGSYDGDRASITQTLQSGESAEILVEIDAAELREDIHTRALEEGLHSLSPDMLAEKAAGYAALKAQALAGNLDVIPLKDWPSFPLIMVRITSVAGLNLLVSQPEVRAVLDATKQYQAHLGQSLPLIEQPAANAAGRDGAGTTIAVLDTGVDYTEPPFNCVAPGPGCQIVETKEEAPDDGDDRDNDPAGSNSGHGTNVSAIAASVAPGATLIVADVFVGNGAAVVDIIDGLEWAMDSLENVVAVNMSLGDTGANPGHCEEGELPAMMGDVLAAGIQPIVSAGNFAELSGSFRDCPGTSSLAR